MHSGSSRTMYGRCSSSSCHTRLCVRGSVRSQPVRRSRLLGTDGLKPFSRPTKQTRSGENSSRMSERCETDRRAARLSPLRDGALASARQASRTCGGRGSSKSSQNWSRSSSANGLSKTRTRGRRSAARSPGNCVPSDATQVPSHWSSSELGRARRNRGSPRRAATGEVLSTTMQPGPARAIAAERRDSLRSRTTPPPRARTPGPNPSRPWSGPQSRDRFRSSCPPGPAGPPAGSAAQGSQMSRSSPASAAPAAVPWTASERQ